MKIARIDNSDGHETTVSIEYARHRIEESGYYKAGTIDECIKAGEDFTLRTPWAHWRFEL